MDINEKLNKIALELSEEYEIVYMGLYGSQNYNLDTEESDIDVKCFVMPNFSSIYERTMISKEVKTSYGIADIKDIRLLPELISKCGLTYLEAFVTDYYVTGKTANNLTQELRRLVKVFINDHLHQLAMVIKQMTKNKIKILTQHPARKKEIAHLGRLELVLQKLDAGLNFKEALFLTDNERENILVTKKVLMSKSALDLYLLSSKTKINDYYKSLAATIAPTNRLDVIEYLNKEVYKSVAESLYTDLKETFEN
jgi:predicted nucleotidyltransferase